MRSRRRCPRWRTTTARTTPWRPILKQAAREALLLMASDWQFVISTGGAKDYGTVRLRNHYDNFQALAGLIRRAAGGQELSVGDWKNIAECEVRDSIFPDVEPKLLREAEHPAGVADPATGGRVSRAKSKRMEPGPEERRAEATEVSLLKRG